MNESAVLKPAEILATKPVFRVFLPGLTGGGTYNTSLRESLHSAFGEDVYVPSSISTRESLNKDAAGIEAHYRQVAHEIGVRAGNKKIEFVAHSLGGYEFIDLAKALCQQDTWQGKDIAINFLSTRGFGERGFKSLTKIFKNLKDMLTHVAGAEQHTAFPLPEVYYQRHVINSSEQTRVLYKDTPEKRMERRRRFHQNLERIVPDVKVREALIQRIAEIDKTIESKITSSTDPEGVLRAVVAGKNVAELLLDRAKLLHEPIQALFHGKHIDPELHEYYQRLYSEQTENLVSPLKYYTTFLLYMARAGRYIHGGMDKKLKEVVIEAKKSDINVRVLFTLLEQDKMITTDDIPTIKNGFSDPSLQNTLEGFAFVEQLAHSGVGYEVNVPPKLFSQAGIGNI